MGYCCDDEDINDQSLVFSEIDEKLDDVTF
jgi:hypothetical protein